MLWIISAVVCSVVTFGGFIFYTFKILFLEKKS